ncbi:MAG: hypothetical protein KF860_03070 [Cyclobacteriaceae bacterium]|nr:hypothetical protein [Cyclobacteriaceae bacterium]
MIWSNNGPASGKKSPSAGNNGPPQRKNEQIRRKKPPATGNIPPGWRKKWATSENNGPAKSEKLQTTGENGADRNGTASSLPSHPGYNKLFVKILRTEKPVRSCSSFPKNNIKYFFKNRKPY